MITLYRIDDRVIHGQTMIKLLPQYPCDGIIIVDDNIAQNSQLLTIYKQVVPDTVKLLCFSVEKAARKLPEAAASNKKYIIIFKNILTIQALFAAGYSIKETISVGTASKKADAKDVIKGFALNQEEVAAYNDLDDQGYKFSIVPMGGAKKSSTWSEIRNKM